MLRQLCPILSHEYNSDALCEIEHWVNIYIYFTLLDSSMSFWHLLAFLRLFSYTWEVAEKLRKLFEKKKKKTYLCTKSIEWECWE